MSHMNEEKMLAEIDPGVRRLVQWLRSKGFETCDSGDGESKPYAKDPDSGGLPYPHVFMQAEDADVIAETLRLLNELQAVGIKIYPVGYFEGDVPPHLALYSGEFPYIQTTYDPVSDVALIELAGVDDSKLPENVP